VKKHSPNSWVEMAIIKTNVCGPSSVIKIVKMKYNWIFTYVLYCLNFLVRLFFFLQVQQNYLVVRKCKSEILKYIYILYNIYIYKYIWKTPRPIVVQESRDFRFLLFLLFLLNKSNAVKTNLLYSSLTPSLFIEILLLSQDRSCCLP
jgi:hypothetical protein